MHTVLLARPDPFSSVCLQSLDGSGWYVRCTNPHCPNHGADAKRKLANHRLAPGERPTINSLRHLWELRLEVERKYANGPWDSWDGRVLEEWLATVKRQISAAETDIEARLHNYGEGRY